jgi:hypothetical protein
MEAPGICLLAIFFADLFPREIILTKSEPLLKNGRNIAQTG